MTARRKPWRVALLPPSARAQRATCWRSGRGVAPAVERLVLASACLRCLSVMTGASATLREPQRLGGELASVAIFVILSFHDVVAGSLLDDLIPRIDHAQVTRINHPEWLMFVVMLSLPVPWVIGRAMSRLHWRSRVATVLICGASAAVIASMTVSVLSSEATEFFFPSAPLQTAAAMVFVLGLLVGGSSSSLHDRQPSSSSGAGRASGGLNQLLYEVQPRLSGSNWPGIWPQCWSARFVASCFRGS
jgi:hypothetical protein